MVEILTASITGLLGLMGIILTLVLSRPKKDPSAAQKKAEHQALAITPTPVTPTPVAYDGSALKLANQAMEQVTGLSQKLATAERRISEVEDELSLFRRSYNSLYSWSRQIITNWAHLRQQDAPPPLPTDIHHP